MNPNYPWKKEDLHSGCHKLTAGLFLEVKHVNSPGRAIFTIKEDDVTIEGITYISLHNIYMEIADPTEYEFALDVFGSYQHWLAVAKTPALKALVEEWREELEVKLRAEAIRAIRTASNLEGAKGTAAAKYIADANWKPKTRGRPSNEEVERTRRIEAGIHEELDDDVKRMRLQ